MNGSPTVPIPYPREPESDCPHCGKRLTYNEGGRGYSTKIGVQLRGVYEGVLWWVCSHCQKPIHRFPEGDERREVAQRWMDKLSAP